MLSGAMLSTVLILTCSPPSSVQHLVAVRPAHTARPKCVDFSDVKACGGVLGTSNDLVGVAEFADWYISTMVEIGEIPADCHVLHTCAEIPAGVPYPSNVTVNVTGVTGGLMLNHRYGRRCVSARLLLDFPQTTDVLGTCAAAQADASPPRRM